MTSAECLETVEKALDQAHRVAWKLPDGLERVEAFCLVAAGYMDLAEMKRQ